MTENADATSLITERYEAWAHALATHQFSWLENNLADDYQFSARPYPELRLDKAGFIEADKKMQSADIQFVLVQAAQLGDIILSTTIADVKESFNGDMGIHLPTLSELNALVGGNRLAYASAWRKSSGGWLCYHHHLIGPIGQ